MPRLLRSVLFVPGVRRDRFAAAVAAGADGVVFDLEDSVDPARKAEARQAIGAFLAGAPATAAQWFVRVNGVGTPWHDEDLAFACRLSAGTGVVLPKTESAAHLAGVAGAVGPRLVVPLLETARGILNAPAIAAASPVTALLFGAEDLTAEIGIPRTTDGEELLFARSQVVLAATTAGAEAIDAVFTDISATEGLRRDATRARALGFRGKMAIHPDQVAVINAVFTPSPDEVARAARIVDAYDAARTRGEGVIRLDGRMVDAPVVTRARRVVAGGPATGT
jgi:citrate lyase beta subunit